MQSEVDIPGEREAKAYMNRHCIRELFDNMTAMLLFTRPDYPKEMMIEMLEKLIAAKRAHTEHPYLFDERNIEAIFRMMDPTGKGFINSAQYKEAMRAMGLKEFSENPEGSVSERIPYTTFMRECRFAIAAAAATYDARKN